jgi:hypothetical protein
LYKYCCVADLERYYLMYTGKHFRMKLEILGIEIADGNRIAIMIPSGQTLRVLSGPRPDDERMVDVLWGDRTLVVFAEDLDRRSEEIRSHAGEAG